MEQDVTIMIMSGVDDGRTLYISHETHGQHHDDQWRITIGRRDENDITLSQDTFVSRHHANLHWRDERWWLEDCKSTNGTFLEADDNFFADQRVTGIVPLEIGQLFRVGRTWLRLQTGA